MSSKERAKGFLKMDHLRPVSSEVALEVRLASCALSNLQTPPRAAGLDDSLGYYGASSVSPKESRVHGRQAGCCGYSHTGERCPGNDILTKGELQK